jgi:site-specific DNA recombinase
MYTRMDSPKYFCRACNNKIPIADLEAIFHDELKAFFANSKKLASHLVSAGETLAQKESQIAGIQESIQKVREEMTRTHRLYLDGEITPQGFGQFYKPAEERLNQMLAELPKLQAEIDLLKVNRLSAEEIMAEATTLYERWPKLPADGRRKIAEAVCEKIVIGKGEIDITLSYLPSSEELCKSQTQL